MEVGQLPIYWLHDITQSFVPLQTYFHIYGYDSPKSHVDSVKSYCFFWFSFYFLDFEDFNDQTAQTGREIIVPYRQNYV